MKTIKAKFTDFVLRQDKIENLNHKQFFNDCMKEVCGVTLSKYDSENEPKFTPALIQVNCDPGMYKGNFSRVSFNSLYPNIIYSHIDLDSQNVTELLHLYLNYKNDLDYSKELWIYLKVCASSLYGSYLTSNERSLVTERARRYLLDFKYLVETVHNSKVYYIDTDMLIIENFRNDTIDFFKSIIGINIPIIFENSKYGFVFENKKKFTFI